MSDYETEFQEILRDLPLDDTPSPEHRERLLEQLLYTMGQQTSPKLHPHIRFSNVINKGRNLMRRRFVRYPAAAATFIGIATVIAWLALSTAAPSTLYAQVMQALDKARSVHVVGKGLEDGKWVKQYEVWYERGGGVAEYGYSHGETNFFRIDNGEYQWIKTRDGDVVRSKSSDPVGVIRKVIRTGTDVLRDEKRFVKDPTGNQRIDGALCDLYVLSYEKGPESDISVRVLIWIDEAKQVRRWDKQGLRDGKWETDRIMEIRYDVPVDPALFVPEIAPGERIADHEKLFQERLGLHNAVFKEEILGHTFAVHEVQWCKEGFIFLLCSSRPTDPTIRQLGPISSLTGDGATVYADFQLDSSWRRVNTRERSYQPHLLGRLYCDGLLATWYLLEPKGAWGEDAHKCELSLYFYTRGKLQENLKAKGLPWWKRFRPLTTLPLPKDKPQALDDVLRKVHSDASGLAWVAFQVWLPTGIKPGPDGTFSVSGGSPSRVSEKMYITAIQRILKSPEKQDRKPTPPEEPHTPSK